MARRFVLLMIIGYGSCMKMQETVERTVMVRTSGSDLQPAATGFIYKRGTNGEAVVTKLGESEVMEQFSKLYDPQEFKGSLPSTGPFAKEQNAALKSEKVIPLKEENVDGIADEDDYKKNVDEYATSFDDYLKGLGSFKEYNNKEFGFDVHHEYEPKAYNDHDTKKYDSYYLARESPYDYRKDFNHEEYKNEYKVPNVAFRYKNNEKDDKDADGFHNNELKHHRGTTIVGGYEKTSDSANDKDSKESDTTSSNDDSTTNSYEGYGAQSGPPASNRYGYKNDH